ncbi:MAG: hypothetical protein NXY57DRAFT_1043921, partial [Lentinula lateritia]
MAQSGWTVVVVPKLGSGIRAHPGPDIALPWTSFTFTFKVKLFSLLFVLPFTNSALDAHGTPAATIYRLRKFRNPKNRNARKLHKYCEDVLFPISPSVVRMLLLSAIVPVVVLVGLATGHPNHEPISARELVARKEAASERHLVARNCADSIASHNFRRKVKRDLAGSNMQIILDP